MLRKFIGFLVIAGLIYAGYLVWPKIREVFLAAADTPQMDSDFRVNWEETQDYINQAWTLAKERVLAGDTENKLSGTEQIKLIWQVMEREIPECFGLKQMKKDDLQDLVMGKRKMEARRFLDRLKNEIESARHRRVTERKVDMK